MALNVTDSWKGLAEVRSARDTLASNEISIVGIAIVVVEIVDVVVVDGDVMVLSNYLSHPPFLSFSSSLSFSSQSFSALAVPVPRADSCPWGH